LSYLLRGKPEVGLAIAIVLTKYNCITISLATSLMITTGLAAISALAPLEVYSDSLAGGALTQRIGNFEVELKTVPAKPLIGEKTILFLRIGSISGDDVEDMPVSIKINKQGEELLRTKTITVPEGHYTFSYIFAKPDIYGIIIEIQNLTSVEETNSSLFSLETGTRSLPFTFPISVHSKSAFGLSELQITLVIGVSVSAFAVIFFSWRRTRNTSRTFFSWRRTRNTSRTYYQRKN
jgi:hypothetical protein